MLIPLWSLAELDYSTTLKTVFYGLLAVGFLSAVIIGSIAWYNSKKPPGWEGAEKPDWVPGMDKETSSKDSE